MSEASESRGSSFIRGDRGGSRLTRFSFDFFTVLLLVGLRMLFIALPFVIGSPTDGSDLGASVLSLVGLGCDCEGLGCESLD